MFKKITLAMLATLAMAQNVSAMSAIMTRPMNIQPAAAEPTTFDKVYTAALVGSTALAAIGYTYAHFKGKQARALGNTKDMFFYDNVKHVAFAVPMMLAFAPAAAYILAAPWRGLHYTASTVKNVYNHTSLQGIAQGIQSLYGKFAKK